MRGGSFPARVRRAVVVGLMVLVTALAGVLMPFAAPIRVFFRRTKGNRPATEQVVPHARVSPLPLEDGESILSDQR